MVRELLLRHEGLLKLRPEYVHRYYSDLNRLHQRRLKRSARQFIPERWIGSSIEAANPPPLPRGGLSMIADSARALTLRDAIRMTPEQMLGPRLVAAHGPEFRILVKILDPGEPIVFHFHATDRQVRSMRRNFPGHRFGKDEAYYFLEAPKGPVPYTHAGLHEGVSRADLVKAVQRGPEYALELSPGFYQRFETGFFLPAGVPHRPGTALTLEVQQPSDVHTLLETQAGGKKLSPRQMYPGFRSLDDAFDLMEMKLSQEVGKLERFRLTAQIETHTGGGEVATVFPPQVCRKFAGKRIRVTRSMTIREDSPLILWVWQGKGQLNGRSAGAGDEFFVTHETARGGIEIVNRTDAVFEAFWFYPVIDSQHGRPNPIDTGERPVPRNPRRRGAHAQAHQARR